MEAGRLTASPAKDWRPTFFTIWAGQALSLFGSSVASFALVWWLTETTGSATVLAMASMVTLLPGVFLGPFAGALVDRWDRRRVMIVADGFVALVSLWLAWLFWSGNMLPWHVYVISLARALGGAFHWPAMQASTSLMVPKEHLPRVAGFNQTLQGGMNIVAPPVGAFLLAVLPLHGIMAIDVVTAALAIACLLAVAIPQPERSEAAPGAAVPTVWADVRAGLRYVRDWPGLTLMLVVSTAVNLLIWPAFALQPLLVAEHFRGGASQLGWLNSAWGVGVVLGGLILGVWGGFRRRIHTAMAGLTGMGAGLVLIGLAPPEAFGLALGAMFLAGAMNPICNGPIFALLQSTVAPDMQGRVFTLMISASQAAAPVGLAIAGPLADVVGPGAWFVLGGAFCAAMGVAGFFIPAAVHLEDGRGQPVAAGSDG
jgi:DHA3 family macrolide efflux protein-like MFS transporter